MNVLILGASGLVGSHTLQLALAHPRITRVIAPTRKTLPGHAKLVNPVSDDLKAMIARVPEWAPDGLICALGTTMAKAGSRIAFREIDYVLPLCFATAAKAAGATTFALVSAMGSAADSRFFYPRTKGELDRDVQAIGYASLTIVRPSIIGGERHEHRAAESIALRLLKVLGPVRSDFA